jgi:kynurenine formamidase
MRAQRPAHARSFEPQQRQYLYEPTSKASKVFTMVSYKCARNVLHTHTHTCT